MEDIYVVLIEGIVYGPFTQKEVGEFCIDYDASFEFFPKPLLQALNLIKLKGADAAELHIAPMKTS